MVNAEININTTYMKNSITNPVSKVQICFNEAPLFDSFVVCGRIEAIT
jgi:hypothetical protein